MSTQSKPRKLTTKQRKFVKAKVEGKTGTQAAIIAYGVDEKTAGVMASQNLGKLSIQEALNAEYQKQGIDMAALVRPIADGLQAEKTIIIGSGDDAFADQIPDHSIRIAAAKLGGQWLGVGKEQLIGGGIHFHQHVQDKKSAYED